MAIKPPTQATNKACCGACGDKAKAEDDEAKKTAANESEASMSDRLDALEAAHAALLEDHGNLVAHMMENAKP